MSFLFETKSVCDIFCQNFVIFINVTPTQQMKLKIIKTIYNTVTNSNRAIISNIFHELQPMI